MAKCIVCGAIESPEDQACIFCFFSGRYFEQVLCSEERSYVLPRIRQLEQVKKAEVWHHGGSMFALTILLKDGRYITPGVFVQAPNGQRAVMPAIPPVGDPWGVAVFSNPMEGEATETSVLPEEFSDEKLVTTIEQLSEMERLVN